MRLGSTQRHIDVEHILDAAVACYLAGLCLLVQLAILDTADDGVIQPDGDLLHRCAGHDPAADQQIVAVVDVAGADSWIDVDPDRRWRYRLLALGSRRDARVPFGRGRFACGFRRGAADPLARGRCSAR
jgi:hypothetical protein